MSNILLILIALYANASLIITSKSFPKDGMIPAKYTCDGENLTPSLEIKGMPKGTRSLAIIMHDPDAAREGGFTHWIVWNIDPVTYIPEKFMGGEHGMNGANKQGYIGPCPPSGIHRYHFNVYALDSKLSVNSNTNKEQLEKAMKIHILAKGELLGLYERKKEVSGK